MLWQFLAAIFLFIFSFRNFYAQNNEIRIGEFNCISGQTARFGQSLHTGIFLAIEEINANGGVLGKRINLITEDDQSKPEDALQSVHKLIEINKVVALLGEIASSRSRAVAPYAQTAKIPMISPASTNPEVTKAGSYIFRTCFIDPVQGKAMANFARKTLHAKRAAVIIDNKQDYCMSVASSFSKTFQEISGSIISVQTYSSGDTEFNEILHAIDSVHPDIIFLPGYYSEVSLIVRQARKMGITIPILGGDGWDSPVLTIDAEKEFNNTYFSNHFSPEDPDKRIQSFVKKYRARFKRAPDNMAALGYDAAGLLVKAIKKIGSTDPQKIRDAIAETKNFPGVTGSITIDKDRNALKPLTVMQFVSGKYHFAQRISANGDPMTKFKPMARSGK